MITSQGNPSPPVKRRRGRPPAANPENAAKTAILNGALKVFARDGFDGASIYEIARHAGVGGPLIHYHFGSKDNLWRETIDYAMRDLSNPFSAIAESADILEPRDAIRLLCKSLAKFAADTPEHVLLLINEIRSPGERLTYVADKYLRDIHGIIDAALIRASENNQIKPIKPAFLTPIIIYSLVMYFSSSPLSNLIYQNDPTSTDEANDYINTVIDVVFNGISL